MAQICTRPARQAAAATTTESVAPVSALNKTQDQHVSTGSNTQTIPKPLALRQSQTLRQKQSLAFAQIMLHASLIEWHKFGTLFYLRYALTLVKLEFLPLSCFGERDLLNLKNPNSNISYSDFVDGCSNPVVEPSKRGQPLKIILRDRNEYGIFDALERNVLEAIQLTVFVDKQNPSHVLESYTFSFNYTEGVQALKRGLEAVSLETTVHSTEVKTFRTAKQGLEMIIRRLITLSTFLPILPNKRFLEIHLFYTDNCPRQYEPQGFKPTAHSDILYPRDDVWKKETQSCGVMDSGCHRVGLKVTSLKCSHEDDNDEAVGRQIPPTLEYSERAERGNECKNRRKHVKMLSLKTCYKKWPLEIPTPDSELIPTQVDCYLNSNPLKAGSGAKPCLSQKQTSRIKGRVNLSQLTQDATGQGLRAGSGKVDCQCGWHEPEPDMLECDFCHTRQHLTCYGFLHPNDEKISATHACYKCLLGSDESKVFRQIETLVLLRQALKIIIEDGYPLRIRDFAQSLHCSGNEVVQITDLLRKNGFLQATPGSKSRGFAEKGLPKFRVPDSEETRQRLRNEIFNPLAKISHHYIIPSTPDAQNKISAVESSMQHVSAYSGRKESNNTDLRHTKPVNTHTVPNSEPIVISEDEDDGINPSPTTPSMNSQATSKGQRGDRVERDNTATTSPPSSPPHSQFPLAPGAQEELRRGLRNGGERSHPPVYANTQFEHVVEPAKEQPFKRRKLSNVAYPIDIGDSTGEESC
ncbi:conserved hypothetical protein [Microsporum canis CBS 113480]|uniref:HORMA domain-containing protein n=1 Tax=Arthroderma otae (strain ATCC MYA-4605 / CBS 113480) TaxID=554155 RepID=C5FL88_ARTOC|nr:conserved hypothetical protein [Microsporum canis CBS 113480]EEQ30460.1 conserved hypothetical protein [Microsporum canis CBS 113480]